MCILALINRAGLRLYGQTAPPADSFGWLDPRFADGSHRADGSAWAGLGSQVILARRGDLRSGGILTETLTPERSDLLASLRGQEAGHLQIVLKNDPDQDGLRHFSEIAAAENILGAVVVIRLVFPDLPGEADALDRFRGTVLGFSLTRDDLLLDVGAI